MRVLFIVPKICNGKAWTPLGIASIAAYLRKSGIDVRIIDNNFSNLDEAQLSREINTYLPDIVGLGGLTVQCDDALSLGRMIKSIDEKIKLVYGGVHFTFKPEDGLKYGDICIIGEGEAAFLEICTEQDPHKIKGIAFKENNDIVLTDEREFIQDLDSIPFPAYDLLEMEKYDDRLLSGEHAISMMTGRGCPYNCVFCASPQLWKRKVRLHSIDYVMSHIAYLVDKHHLKHLRIMDDTFTVNKKRVLEFCDKIEKNKFRLNMTCLTHVKNADYEMFKRMKEAGFSIVAFGVESGNEDILKLVNKGTTRDDIRHAVSQAKKAGLDTELLFMVGNIGEKKGTILDSINFAKELSRPEINSNTKTYSWFQFATPFPGSMFFDVYRQYGRVIDENWSGYHHQKPVFLPNDLDEATMVELRELALKETNLDTSAWSWLPSRIRGSAHLQALYSCLLKLKSKLSSIY